MSLLSLPMRRVLLNLHRGRPGTSGLVGQSEHGGYQATWAALYRRGLVDDGKLTEAGRREAEKLAKASEG